jgi:hypothetical protein
MTHTVRLPRTIPMNSLPLHDRRGVWGFQGRKIQIHRLPDHPATEVYQLVRAEACREEQGPLQYSYKTSKSLRTGTSRY